MIDVLFTVALIVIVLHCVSMYHAVRDNSSFIGATFGLYVLLTCLVFGALFAINYVLLRTILGSHS